MVSILIRDLQWTLAAAGATLAVSQVAGVVARIAWVFVSDRWFGPRRVLLGLALGMATCGLLAPRAMVEAAVARDAAIVWTCSGCSADGRISNCQGSLWDLRDRSAARA